jgi:2-oxoglutarate ferredoxin oxidoreductase subunit gamma
MNQPSLLRFQNVVTEGGLLIVNSSLAKMDDIKRNGIRVREVPMNDMAIELGNTRLTNMVALGAYAELSGAIEPEELSVALQSVIPARNHKLIPLNEKAILRGAAYAGRR